MDQWVSNGSNELHFVSDSPSINLLNGLIAPSFLCLGKAVTQYILLNLFFLCVCAQNEKKKDVLKNPFWTSY